MKVKEMKVKEALVYGIAGLVIIGACAVKLFASEPSKRTVPELGTPEYLEYITEKDKDFPLVPAPDPDLDNASNAGIIATTVTAIADEVEPPAPIKPAAEEIKTWPEIDSSTGAVFNNANQIRVLERENENSSYMHETEFTTMRTSPDQLSGTIHFVDEAGNKVADDVTVFFEKGQLLEIKVPYCPGLYSDRPFYSDWENFDISLTYFSVRPLCNAWDQYPYLRTLIPGQY